MNVSDIGAIVGIAVLSVLLLPLIIGAVFVIVVVANRADPDPTTRRPATVYTFATSFFALFVALFASLGIVASLCSLIGTRESDGPGLHPVGDGVARSCVLGALVFLVAGAILRAHLRGGLRLAGADPGAGPLGRVRGSYAAAVSFVCVLIVAAAVVVAAYQVFIVISPAVFGPDDNDRVAPLRAMLPAIYLAIAAALILRFHVRLSPPALRRALAWFPTDGGAGGAPEETVPTEAT